jgi:type IV pilus assembly protein PilC
MADRQAKGFYQQMEAHETFELNKQKEVDAQKQGDFVMNIGADKKIQRIFLNKQSNLSHITGNPLIDTFHKVNDYFIDHSSIKVKEIAVTFRLLAVMINAGLPLIRSLNTLSVQSEKNPKLSKILAELARDIETGNSLSKAMEKYPEVFSEAQIGAIQAGEASGQLNKTLLDLAAEAEKSASIAGKVKGALIYPMVILSIMFIVIFLMMVLVVPQISKLYGEAGKDLPAATKILMSVSKFMVSYWWAIIAGIVGMIFAIGTWKKTKSGSYYWDLLMLSLPIFGDLVKKSTLSKFAYGFGNLLASGVPIIKAMEIVATASGNEVYRKRFLLTAEDMKGGIPMAENLSNSKLFPTMLVNMIEVGEQTAQLENVTQKVAAFYDEEVSNSVTALTKAMEPLIIVVVGVVVGGLVAAIMLPIIQLTDITN